MPLCSAVNCDSRSGKKRLYEFPKDRRLRKRWIIAMKRDKWIPGSGARLCEDHFQEPDFFSHNGKIRRLKAKVIPSKFFFTKTPNKRTTSNSNKLEVKNVVKDSNETSSQEVINFESHFEKANYNIYCLAMRTKVK